MSENSTMIFAYQFDGKGAHKELDWESAQNLEVTEGFLWFVLDRRVAGIDEWISSRKQIEEWIAEALLAEESRPRLVSNPTALLVLLRGVNLNPGSDPEDMIALQMVISQHMVVTLRDHRILALQDVREELKSDLEILSPGDLLSIITTRLIDRMGPVLDELNDEIDELEVGLLEENKRGLSLPLSNLRLQTISLRRYLAPQRDVLSHLSLDQNPQITDAHRVRFRESADKLTRYVEDLDSMRERASITSEQVNMRVQDKLNSNMYVLSIITAIFLPLGFLTGLLGINVGGIPGTNSDNAFFIVCTLLGLIAGVELLIFFRKKWL